MIPFTYMYVCIIIFSQCFKSAPQGACEMCFKLKTQLLLKYFRFMQILLNADSEPVGLSNKYLAPSGNLTRKSNSLAQFFKL